jgi:hypothetical protein
MASSSSGTDAPSSCTREVSPGEERQGATGLNMNGNIPFANNIKIRPMKITEQKKRERRRDRAGAG